MSYSIPIEDLLSEEAQNLLEKEKNSNPFDFRLRYAKDTHLPIEEIALQIEALQRIKSKVDDWQAHKQLIFPSPLAAEQASSKITAKHKAQYLKGEVLIDLTGGLGVDTFFLSHNFAKVFYVEKSNRHAQAAAHNFAILGAKNIKVCHQSAEDFLMQYEGKADWIYIDPARRKDKQKVFRLEDCQPNLEVLLQSKLPAKQMLLKLAPMLDIKAALQQLPQTEAVHILALQNECKELLFFLDMERAVDLPMPRITCQHIDSDGKIQNFDFDFDTEAQAQVQYSNPLDYLYQPNAAILKGGAFRSIAQSFGIFKIARHTHLYTSMEYCENFPGRVWRVEAEVQAQKKHIKRHFKEGKAMIISRNYPLSAEKLGQKLGLQSGGELYLIAMGLEREKKTLLLAKRLE
ncbi:MAG: hypothetical protein JJT94_03770 [Bernardetiaceae bacterium]|nr:hypothetical protein [Bernardetiaceae bacterium]